MPSVVLNIATLLFGSNKTWKITKNYFVLKEKVSHVFKDLYLGLDTKIPVFGVCEQQRGIPAYASRNPKDRFSHVKTHLLLVVQCVIRGFHAWYTCEWLRLLSDVHVLSVIFWQYNRPMQWIFLPAAQLLRIIWNGSVSPFITLNIYSLWWLTAILHPTHWNTNYKFNANNATQHLASDSLAHF